MTEEPKVEETVSEEPQAERSIADELAKLGQQLAAAAQKAWDSDERRRLQNEITTGVQRLGQELSGAVGKAADSEQAKELKTRATKVAEDVQKTDVIEEVRKGLLVGLEAINRELGKMLERMEPKTEAAEVVAPVTGAAAGETVVVAETPVVPDVAPDEETPVA
jgi:hypothetical protein